ncbi:MAG: M16 family metallopeptidase [Armatimonadota bacterium]
MYIAILMLLCITMDAHAALPIPNPFPLEGLSCSTLPNGLRLVVREDHSLPIVTMVVVVRGGGGANINPRGLAHYLEHLVLQGSRQYPEPLAPQFALEQVGGTSNAVTSRDLTRFAASVDSASVELLTKVLADVTLHPLLTDEAFADERPVILAEIQRGEDTPLAYGMNRAFSLSYRNHPYRESPLGSITEILTLTADDVRQHYHRWYLPNNMSVVLVGDVTPARAQQLVQQAFGGAKSGRVPAFPPPETASESMAVAHYPQDQDDTLQILAFPAPASSDFATMAATDLVMTLLINGGNALLPAHWARNGIAVMQSGAEFASQRDPGRLFIWAKTKPEDAVKWRDVTVGFLRTLTVKPIPDDVLAAGKQRMAAQFLLDNESYSQQATTLAIYEALGGAKLACQYLPTVQGLTGPQVQHAVPTRPLAWVTIGKKPKGGL